MNNAYGWFYQEGYAQNYMMTSKIDGQDVRWEINQPAKLAGVRKVMERVAKWLYRQEKGYIASLGDATLKEIAAERIEEFTAALRKYML